MELLRVMSGQWSTAHWETSRTFRFKVKVMTNILWLLQITCTRETLKNYSLQVWCAKKVVGCEKLTFEHLYVDISSVPECVVTLTGPTAAAAADGDH